MIIQDHDDRPPKRNVLLEKYPEPSGRQILTGIHELASEYDGHP